MIATTDNLEKAPEVVYAQPLNMGVEPNPEACLCKAHWEKGALKGSEFQHVESPIIAEQARQAQREQGLEQEAPQSTSTYNGPSEPEMGM